jgi:CUB domain
VALTFVQFDTETNYDFVQLFDGPDNTSTMIATLTGSLYYQAIFYSTQQYMYIRFTSDASVTSNGFNATYQSVTSTIPTTPTYTTTTGPGISHLSQFCLPFSRAIFTFDKDKTSILEKLCWKQYFIIASKRAKINDFLNTAVSYIRCTSRAVHIVGNLQLSLTYAVFTAPLAALHITR